MAKKNGPCVIFIDEIDAVGGHRVQDHGFYRLTINELLTQMDGFDSKDKVLVIGSRLIAAATNMPKSLDKALTRSGRFDKKITLSLPSQKEREKLLHYYLEKLRAVSPALNVESLARMMVTKTGADVKNLVNQAALAAIQKGSDLVRTEGEDHQTSMRPSTICIWG